MRKFILTAFMVFALTNSVYAGDFWSNLQQDFSNAFQTIKNDASNVNSQVNRGQSSDLSLQSTIDELKAQKAKELEPINKQISEKEAAMRKILVDAKLSVSQKKSQTTLLQKEISTLKTQKENIEEKYRAKIQEFRYY